MTVTTVSPIPQQGRRTTTDFVADIGGTNARFALSDSVTGSLSHFRTLSCAGGADLTELVDEYRRLAGLPAPTRMCIALAGPISSDLCGATNTELQFSISDVRNRLGLERFEVINDFAAIANAIPALSPASTAQLGSPLLRDDRPKAVIGPGTGLGMAGLVPDHGEWRVITSEGGHTAAAPQSDFEEQVIHVLRQTHGYVSAETICSGPGLVRTHTAISAVLGVPVEPLTAAEITTRAIEGSATLDGDIKRSSDVCIRTLDLFCDQLAGVAATAALTFNALGGVYIGGGIPSHIADFLHRSNFRDRFQDHPQMGGYLSQIATVRITETNPGLIGASHWLGHTAA